MKICTQCNIEKDDVEFRWRKKELGRRHSACRTCCTTIAKEKRHSTPEIFKKRRKAFETKTRQRNCEYIWQFLVTHPCIDCNESDPVVLEFDHLFDKEYQISEMVKGHSLNSIKKEIEKCVVRCANCHRRKTAIERNYFKIQRENL